MYDIIINKKFVLICQLYCKYPDIEYVSEQTISADSKILAEINSEDNAYELSIKVKTTGYAENHIKVKESGYSSVVESDMILGTVPEIYFDNTCNEEKIVLYYNMANNYTANDLGVYAAGNEELSGIKRLGIFTFNEEYDILVPIPTKYDVENNTVYAETDKSGTYFLVDIEKWLDLLDVEPNVSTNIADKTVNLISYSLMSSGMLLTNNAVDGPVENNKIEDSCESEIESVPMMLTADLYNASDVIQRTAEKEKIAKADIVFSVDISNTSKNYLGDTAEENLERVKQNIRDAAKQTFDDGEDIRIAVYGFTTRFSVDEVGYLTSLPDGSKWATNMSELDILMSQLSVDHSTNYALIECGMQDVAYPMDPSLNIYDMRAFSRICCSLLSRLRTTFTFAESIVLAMVSSHLVSIIFVLLYQSLSVVLTIHSADRSAEKLLRIIVEGHIALTVRPFEKPELVEIAVTQRKIKLYCHKINPFIVDVPPEHFVFEVSCFPYIYYFTTYASSFQ